MPWPEEPFWTYSLELYARPGVEAACLELQRRHGVDVNLVLLCCWLATRGIELDQITLARAKRAVVDWQAEVVRPLRALRRRLGATLSQPEPNTVPAWWPELAGDLRLRVLALELDGEHLAQLGLGQVTAELKPTARPGPALAGRNLQRYWTFSGGDLHSLRNLLRAVFAEASVEDLAVALSWIGG